MLSDSDIIDNVNPFVNYPPGAWAKPYPFSGYMKMEEDQIKEDDPSPACNMATTAGDRQIDWCKPGVPNCPMSRALEPTQRVEPDISYDQRGDVPFGENIQMEDPSPRFVNKQLAINLMVLMLFIFLLVKITERL
jgi:hypothetical protein